MNRKTLFLLLGVLTLGFAANAQTTDTTHIMHHRFHRAPGDSAFHRPASPGAFHRPGGFPGRDGYAFHRPEGPGSFHRPGQNRFGRGHGRGHREFVHYTPDQRKQVMAINKDYRQKAADLFKQDNITLKQYKAGLITLQKEKKTKLEGLLTPLQKDEVALRRKRRTDDAQLKADSRLERLKQSLSLTDDQVAKLKTGQDNLRTQAEAIRANDNLLPQEKHEQMKTLMTTRNDNFKTILTPDQYTKFQQMMSHRRGGPGGPGGPGSPGGGPWQGRGGFGGRTT
jgi:Spy/CpxP family protein refolding chaperone